jgi:glycosyltransferase involved in cell wall biosynthesis
MRVGIDVGPATITRTGVGNYCFYLVKHLLRLGPECCELVGFSSGLAKVELGDLHGYLRHLHVPVPTRVLYKSWSLLKSPKVDRLLGGVDVYHATNYFLPPTHSARRVVTIHDLAFLAVPELCSPKIVGPFSKGIRGFAHSADAILAYSESTKRDIVRLLGVAPEKVTVAPLAVDEEFAPLTKETASARLETRYAIRPPFLLFVGTLEPRKNVCGLLKGFARVARDIPHKLVLVGSLGWNTREIFRVIDHLGLGDRVILPGFVPQCDLPAFYCAANAFVFPTLYEGFGLPLLEALTCGCPVITYNNSSVPEVTGGAALYVEDTGEEALAEAIRRIIEDNELRTRLVAAGREHAGKFSWDACARSTLDVYRRLATC